MANFGYVDNAVEAPLERERRRALLSPEHGQFHPYQKLARGGELVVLRLELDGSEPDLLALRVLHECALRVLTRQATSPSPASARVPPPA